MIITVNRLGPVQLKGNLEKKIVLMQLEDIVQQEDAMKKELYHKVKLNLYGETNGFKIVLR